MKTFNDQLEPQRSRAHQFNINGFEVQMWWPEEQEWVQVYYNPSMEWALEYFNDLWSIKKDRDIRLVELSDPSEEIVLCTEFSSVSKIIRQWGNMDLPPLIFAMESIDAVFWGLCKDWELNRFKFSRHFDVSKIPLCIDYSFVQDGKFEESQKEEIGKFLKHWKGRCHDVKLDVTKWPHVPGEDNCRLLASVEISPLDY